MSAHRHVMSQICKIDRLCGTRCLLTPFENTARPLRSLLKMSLASNSVSAWLASGWSASAFPLLLTAASMASPAEQCRHGISPRVGMLCACNVAVYTIGTIDRSQRHEAQLTTGDQQRAICAAAEAVQRIALCCLRNCCHLQPICTADTRQCQLSIATCGVLPLS